jgi:hypothetical protein
LHLRAIARLVSLSRKAAKQLQYDLPAEIVVRSVVDELATASMSDPRHVPTLKNLATLFNFLGDAERSKLASRLAEEASSADPVPANGAAHPSKQPPQSLLMSP